MCLAVPAKVIELDQTEAVVDLHGNRLRVSALLVPETALGDWVLVHAGFIIQRLDEAAARETWKLMAELDAAEHAANEPGSAAT